MGRGKRVAVITNDQAPGLVDSSIGLQQGLPVAEVAGGCFCCKFDNLLDAVQSVMSANPDVILCEPVGSCTDMAATVLNPLKRYYPGIVQLLPFTVLVDPIRLCETVLKPGETKFDPEVGYIFHKQLEEADAIAITKCDTLADAEAAEIAAQIEERYQRTVLLTSSIEDRGIGEWADYLLSAQPVGMHVLSDVDYDTYATGEAVLGWLNATVRVTHASGCDARTFVGSLLEEMQAAIASEGAEIAHLKAAISGEEAYVRGHLTSTSGSPMYHPNRVMPLTRGQLILNARVAIDPERLEKIARAAIERSAAASQLTSEIETMQCFRPGYPRPPYRILGVL
jgi:CobW/HypB/UreG, nucleotide-binding domain